MADLRPPPPRRPALERSSDAPRPAAAPRVLIVEDDRKVAQALREGLAREGFDASVEASGEGAFFRLDEATYDVVLLDLGLPGRDGLQILRRLRERGLATPVLILTARDAVSDRVLGLDSGADDYLVKPFAFAEVLARTRALVRRGRAAEPPRLAAGSIEIDLATRTVTRDGRTVALTLTEFDVLEHLVRHEGQVVSREALVHDVWRESARSTTLDNVIDVHMARLRKKLEDESAPRLIQTIRGVGFLFKSDGEAPTS